MLTTVATPIGYQPFCPMGAALNVIGERWALLIVRDLLLGPRRYTELLTGLGGIGTDILAARLRGLQQHGVVRQAGSGRNRRYELTDGGQALRPVLVELGRWGVDRMQLPADHSKIPPRVPLTALLIGATKLPRQTNGLYEFRIADEVLQVEVTGGQVQAAPGTQPPTTITLTVPGLRDLILGAPAFQLKQNGDAAIEGDDQRAVALLDALSAPPRLEQLRRQFASQPSRSGR